MSGDGVLVLGSRGRLGAALTRCWGARGASRQDVDVSDLDALRAFLRGARFSTLVNGTGMTSLEECEDKPALAKLVNARAPKVMAEEASRAGARLIHFSTDYVFDGTLGRAYAEDDTPNPLSVYGRGKLEGERAVLNVSNAHVCARVSWVFGPEKPSFVDMILSRAIRGEPTQAVADKTSCPTFTDDVAVWLLPFIEGQAPGGLYHACNFGGCSWMEYGQGALDIASELGWPMKTKRVEPIRLRDVAVFRAARPPDTVMDCSRLTQATGIRPRPWREALRDYLKAMRNGRDGGQAEG